MFSRTLLLVAVLAALAFADTYTVNTDVLNVRSGPGTGYSIVKQLTKVSFLTTPHFTHNIDHLSSIN